MYRRLLLIVVVFSNHFFAQQSKIDSLYIKLKQVSQDTQKVNILNKLFTFYNSSNNDSSLKFSRQAYALASKIKYFEGEITAVNNIGTVCYYQGKNAEALKYFLESVKLSEALKTKKPNSVFASKQMSRAYNNIGTIYQRQNDLSKAEEFFLKSIAFDLSINDLFSASHGYNNIGTIKEAQNKYDEAIINYEKSLDIKTKANDSIGIPSTLINIGVIKMNDKKFEDASSLFLRALLICDKTNNQQDKALCLINLGDLFYLKKDYHTSIVYYKDGIELCKKQHYLQYLSYAYQSTSLAYYRLKEFENAYEYFQHYSSTKDSIYNQDNARIIREMEAKYETDTKEKEIKLLTADKELHQAQLNKNRIIIYSSIAGLILIAGFAFYVFYALNQKKKINRELDLRNKKIEHAYHIIDEKQREVMDSINYAKRIQYALLANDDFLNKYIPSHFVLFKPKDIVSGDFYWATQIHNKQNEDLFYLAVCDSTGHGVPGAFMSLLSIGFLSEAIKEKDIFEPNQVFNYVRKRLIESISNEQQKDGFDGILMCFNKTTGVITYASSNNKPVLVNAAGSELIELPGDKMPVGKGEVMDDFKLYTVNYQSGDSIYLYTDGYADQFGGPKGKKFKYKQLEDILQQNSAKPLVEQKEILSQRFTNWQDDLEQVDDVCVIGIKL